MSKELELLILDDDPSALSALEKLLRPYYRVYPFTDPRAATSFLNSKSVSLAVLDLNLDGTDGLDVLKQWQARFPDLEIVLCSGEARVGRVVECLRAGAADFVTKPIDVHDLLSALKRAARLREIEKNAELGRRVVYPGPVPAIGESPAFRELLTRAQQVRGETHLNVLILGESGTSKELIARVLHQQEQDPERPFVATNMAAIPQTLVEAELFGVERGAFTDARTPRAGKFEMAEGGDIFLDEIGDLPLETQAKLLRVLQEKTVERLGSNRTHRIDFRVISATHRSPAILCRAGRFREDLLYRLSDLVIVVPPLRERKEDILLLANHLVRLYQSRRRVKLSPQAEQKLLDHHWPGNIRELESTIKRALIFNAGSVIQNIELHHDHLGAFDAPSKAGAAVATADGGAKVASSLDAQLENLERDILDRSLHRHRGDKAAVMQELGLSKTTLYRKLTQHQLIT